MEEEKQLRWEVYTRAHPCVHRLKIDGGWLYMVDHSKTSVTFVPDKEN